MLTVELMLLVDGLMWKLIFVVAAWKQTQWAVSVIGLGPWKVVLMRRPIIGADFNLDCLFAFLFPNYFSNNCSVISSFHQRIY